MSWYAIVDNATGVARAFVTADPGPETPAGCVVLVLSRPPDQTSRWNPVTRTLDAVTLPDLRGFYLALTQAFGLVLANTWMQQQTVILRMLDTHDWARARTAIDAALVAGQVTQAQHDQILALMTTYGLT